MGSVCNNVLNPVGVVQSSGKARAANPKSSAAKPVIGLLNNSKPNAAFFLAAIEDELRRGGEYDTISVTKPRSAAAAPSLDTLAERCHFVISAVAD